MPKKTKRQPPSRIRYEQSHPTVSCRLPRAIYDRLMQAKEVESKSFADILKIGLGVQEVQARKVREAKKRGYNEGYQKGYAEATVRFKVTYRCSKCGGELVVSTDDEKKAIAKYMQEHDWRHGECLQPRR